MKCMTLLLNKQLVFIKKMKKNIKKNLIIILIFVCFLIPNISFAIPPLEVEIKPDVVFKNNKVIISGSLKKTEDKSLPPSTELNAMFSYSEKDAGCNTKGQGINRVDLPAKNLKNQLNEFNIFKKINISDEIIDLKPNKKYFYCLIGVVWPPPGFGFITFTQNGNFTTPKKPTTENYIKGVHTGDKNIPDIEIDIKEVSDKHAIMQGSVEETGSPAYAYFRYSTADTPPIFCNDIYGSNMRSAIASVPNANGLISGGNNFFAKVYGLESDTVYYYCAVVSNKATNPTEIKYGEVKKFRTDPCETCPHTTVSTAFPQNITKNSATLVGFYSSTRNIKTYFKYRLKPKLTTVYGAPKKDACGKDIPVDLDNQGGLGQTNQNTDWIYTKPEIHDEKNKNHYGKMTFDVKGLKEKEDYEVQAIVETIVSGKPSILQPQTFYGDIIKFSTNQFDPYDLILCNPFTPDLDPTDDPDNTNFNGDLFNLGNQIFTYFPGSINSTSAKFFGYYRAIDNLDTYFEYKLDDSVVVKQGKDYSWKKVGNTFKDKNTSGNITFNIGGLERGTSYKVRAVAQILPDFTVADPDNPNQVVYVPKWIYGEEITFVTRKNALPCVGADCDQSGDNNGGNNNGNNNGNTNGNNSGTGSGSGNSSIFSIGNGSGVWSGGNGSGVWSGNSSGLNGPASGTWSGPNGASGTWSGNFSNGVGSGTWSSNNGTGSPAGTGSGISSGSWSGSNSNNGSGSGSGSGASSNISNFSFDNGSGTWSGSNGAGTWNGSGSGIPDGNSSGTWKDPDGNTGTWTGNFKNGVGTGTWKSDNGKGNPGGSGNGGGANSGAWSGVFTSNNAGGAGSGSGSGSGDQSSGVWAGSNSPSSLLKGDGTWSGSNGAGTWNGSGSGIPDGTSSGTWKDPDGNTGTWTGSFKNGVGTGTWKSDNGKGNPGGAGSGANSGAWSGVFTSNNPGGAGSGDQSSGVWAGVPGNPVDKEKDKTDDILLGNDGKEVTIGSSATPDIDDIVRYHEGVEHVFARRIKKSFILQQRYGYSGDLDLQQFAWDLSHKLAINFGYVDNKGKEIRVNKPDVSAYAIRLIGEKLTVYEYYKNKIIDIRNIYSPFKNKNPYEYYSTKDNKVIKP